MPDWKPPFAAFMAILLVVGVYLNIGHAKFYRDPGSIFFQPARANERKYSLAREREAAAFLDRARAHGPEAGYVQAGEAGAPKAVDMCVGIATVPRGDGVQGVDLTIASLLDGLTAPEKRSVYTTVLFAHDQPELHPSWAGDAHIRDWLEDAWAYSSPTADLSADVRALVAQLAAPDLPPHQLHAKSMLDYSLVLERCLQRTRAPFIAVVEDDVLVAKGWVARTLQALWATERKYPTPKHDWLDLRLFNQERSTGWATRTVGGNHELPIVLALDFFILLGAVSSRRRHAAWARYATNTVLALVCAGAVPLFVVLFFQTGKASLIPPRGGVSVENFGCCSQALIYNRRHVEGLVQYLRDAIPAQLEGREDEQYDMRTRDFAAQHALDRLALYPMQAQHLGGKSSVGASDEASQAVWSMAFEDLVPDQLEWAHTAAMRKVYGQDSVH